jgi:undecaprenyl diphosphate synthase
MKSALQIQAGLHVAVIMDGNGRWATKRGLPRVAGHRAGVEALRPILEAAPDLGVGVLTVYAFSADNWRRPPQEVNALMGLLRAYLKTDRRRFIEGGARLSVIGRRDRLPAAVLAEIAEVEAATAGGEALHVRVALDYSARESIAAAARRWAAEPEASLDRLGELLRQSGPDARPVGDVDLLIRTGGEQRLSDFLLWEAAYAELWFTQRMWPDFAPEDLAAAIGDYQRRERRFGGLVEPQVRAAVR